MVLSEFDLDQTTAIAVEPSQFAKQMDLTTVKLASNRFFTLAKMENGIGKWKITNF